MYHLLYHLIFCFFFCFFSFSPHCRLIKFFYLLCNGFDLTIFFYVYVFEYFILEELRSLGIKTIWEFTHKWVLAPKYARNNVPKALKGFCWFLFIFNGTLLFFDDKITAFLRYPRVAM